MSSLLKDNASYIALILNTSSKTQAAALLDTATREQIRTLDEICRNLLSLPLSSTSKQTIDTKRTFLTRFTNPKLTSSAKGKLISKHYRLMLTILFAVKRDLLDVIYAMQDAESCDDTI